MKSRRSMVQMSSLLLLNIPGSWGSEVTEWSDWGKLICVKNSNINPYKQTHPDDCTLYMVTTASQYTHRSDAYIHIDAPFGFPHSKQSRFHVYNYIGSHYPHSCLLEPIQSSSLLYSSVKNTAALVSPLSVSQASSRSCSVMVLWLHYGGIQVVSTLCGATILSKMIPAYPLSLGEAKGSVRERERKSEKGV